MCFDTLARISASEVCDTLARISASDVCAFVIGIRIAFLTCEDGVYFGIREDKKA